MTRYALASVRLSPASKLNNADLEGASGRRPWLPDLERPSWWWRPRSGERCYSARAFEPSGSAQTLRVQGGPAGFERLREDSRGQQHQKRGLAWTGGCMRKCGRRGLDPCSSSSFKALPPSNKAFLLSNVPQNYSHHVPLSSKPFLNPMMRNE